MNRWAHAHAHSALLDCGVGFEEEEEPPLIVLLVLLMIMYGHMMDCTPGGNAALLCEASRVLLLILLKSSSSAMERSTATPSSSSSFALRPRSRLRLSWTCKRGRDRVCACGGSAGDGVMMELVFLALWCLESCDCFNLLDRRV